MRLVAQKAQEIIDEFGTINGLQINLLNLAHLAAHKGSLNEAITYTLEGIDAAKTLKDDATEIIAYKMMANFYRLDKNYEKALEYQTIYSKIQEEFAKVRRSRQFLDLEIRHAIQDKQREIEQLTRENDYQSLLLEKSDQIARQNQELLNANEELRQFAYVVSHDLKEPLRMIGSYTQILKKMLNEKLEGDSQQYFDYVTEGVERMNALLNGLLQYATIGRSEEPEENIDLNLIAEIAKNNLKVRIEENEASIHQDQLPMVFGRRTMFLQLFQNLLGNAIKFKKEGTPSEVWINFRAFDTHYEIDFKDNGIGIAEQNMDRIFEIFQRLHTRTQYEGTGIGLAICQKITQRLGGRLTLASKVGVGSTFTVHLPRGVVAAKAE